MKPFIPQRLPLEKIDWHLLLPRISQANRAIAEYRGSLFRLRNPEILMSPLTGQEAVLSSQIEGTQATLSEVLKFEAGDEAVSETKRNDIQEILNYRAALQAAQERLKTHPFSLNLLLRLHEILLNSVRGYNKNRGYFRKTQNWIGRPGSTQENAQFVPPAAHLLPEYLDNWEKYYHADESDALVQLAIIHAQFELLHPFLDGNGRLGRILIPLFLYEKKILFQPVFYLSSYLERYREIYIEQLHKLGETKQWETWITFFLEALAQQARNNFIKIQKIMELYEEFQNVILLTRSQWAIPLLDQIFKRPLFAGSHLKWEKNHPSAPAILALLKKLVDRNILTILQQGRGSKSAIYICPRLINLCEDKTVF
ncbi:MAG: Fic/DOC family N-terminal domain-containing protein [Verrucomicrobiia bacterium]